MITDLKHCKVTVLPFLIIFPNKICKKISKVGQYFDQIHFKVINRIDWCKPVLLWIQCYTQGFYFQGFHYSYVNMAKF